MKLFGIDFHWTWGDTFTLGFGLLGAVLIPLGTAIATVPGSPEEGRTWLISTASSLGTAALVYLRAYVADYLKKRAAP